MIIIGGKHGTMPTLGQQVLYHHPNFKNAVYYVNRLKRETNKVSFHIHLMLNHFNCHFILYHVRSYQKYDQEYITHT